MHFYSEIERVSTLERAMQVQENILGNARLFTLAVAKNT